MRRLAALIAALGVALMLAPAALAANAPLVVNDPGDAPDFAPGDGICDTVDSDPSNGTPCTLRAAIQQANASIGADLITFSGAGQAPQPLTGFSGSDAVTGPTTIDGGKTTTITFAPGAAGPLYSVTGADTTLRGLTVTGGASGTAISLTGVRGRLDTVTVHDVKGDGVFLSGDDARLDAVQVSHAGGNGFTLTGARTTVTAPEIATATGNGISVAGDGASISGGRIHDNGGNGVSITGQGGTVAHVILFANGGKPISLDPGANGDIPPPQDLRIGPRGADGVLRLSGSNPSGGTYEIFHGSPFSATEPTFLEAFGADPGAFTYNFAGEPPPGDTFALTVTNGGTSEFATVAVPSDVTSPDIIRAGALSPTEVRIIPSEPLDPGSVQPQDFTLTMAGQDRPVSATATATDGSAVTLTSSGWKAGEAGYVQLAGAGVLNDLAGNASQVTTRLRVAAAPGDFIAPIAGQLALSPRSICLTHGRGCPTTGTTIRFVTTESGKATVVIQRGNRRIGKRVYNAVGAGLNSLKFNGRLGGRKLRAGRYRLLVYVQDLVGNVSDEPPIALLSVRRVSK